jgi:hypothetical protein
MYAKEHKEQERKFLVKAYPNLVEIENTVTKIIQENETHLQLSILGKLSINGLITKKGLDKIVVNVKQLLKNILGKHFQFGHFHNPEIGILFIAGHLTPTFLNKVDERELAALPAGLYGIFRGLGIDSKNIDTYLSVLKNENYFLIIRGESDSLDTIKPLLNKTFN